MTENSSANDLSAAEPDDDDDESSPVPGLTASYAERYGIRRGMSRTRKIMLGVFGFVVLCGVAGYIAWNEANPQIQASVVSYTVSGSSITVTFEVDKKSSQSVECTIQAEDLQGDVIGSANVSVPSGRAEEDMVYTVNTTGTPNTAVVSTCDVTS
jgi:type IV secretory pathway TrbF-like protein